MVSVAHALVDEPPVFAIRIDSALGAAPSWKTAGAIWKSIARSANSPTRDS